jgi:hypothetical protein
MRLTTIGEEQLANLGEKVEARLLPPPSAYEGSLRLLPGRR